MQTLLPLQASTSLATAALEGAREESASLAALLELDPEIVPIFVFRLTCFDAGQKALRYRGANIEAVRSACVDHIQIAISEGLAKQAEPNTGSSSLIARAIELASAHPDPGARVANVCDFVTALYERAETDRSLRELLEGRRPLSASEQVTVEAQKIAEVLQKAVQDQIEDAQRRILEEVLRPRGSGKTALRMAAGIVILFGLVLLAMRWTGGLADVQLTITSLNRLLT